MSFTVELSPTAEADVEHLSLYEIVTTSKVVVLAVRHQREEDYH